MYEDDYLDAAYEDRYESDYYPDDDYDDRDDPFDDGFEDYDAELAADEILERQELEDFEQADEYFGASAEDIF
jgi:hypothetical protein